MTELFIDERGTTKLSEKYLPEMKKIIVGNEVHIAGNEMQRLNAPVFSYLLIKNYNC